jgi:hypothetical protein
MCDNLVVRLHSVYEPDIYIYFLVIGILVKLVAPHGEVTFTFYYD